MKDIYTVIIHDDGEVSTVSFLNRADAMSYAVSEITESMPVDANEVAEELDRQMFWSDGNGYKVYIEEAKLCNSFDGKL